MWQFSLAIVKSEMYEWNLRVEKYKCFHSKMFDSKNANYNAAEIFF